MAKALDGVRILDFSQFLAGPHCSMLLQEMGAEVIKVEVPGKGDPERVSMPLTEKREAFQFICRNRGKKSITLNLKNPKGLEMAKALAVKADVLVENFATGVMERLGLGYDVLREINPALIYASITGFGHTGPRRLDPSYDLITQAMGGAMSVTGFPETPPTKVGVSLGDYLGGFNAAIAILCALYYRMFSGEGQSIDISMQDSVWAMVLPDRADYFVTHDIPKRSGNSYPQAVPFGSYAVKDGFIIICIITDPQWTNFLRVIARADLVGDERYATREKRTNSRPEVEALVNEWCRTKTAEEALTALKNGHVPCSPIPGFDQVAEDPQLLSRQMIVEVEQPVSGKVKLAGSVFKMSETPGDRRCPAPALGEHNQEIYTSILGLSLCEIENLKQEGVI
jgi:CoA:oxalate CoA-transferase